MIKGILICLYDAKADNYSPPQCADSKASAIRQFEMLVNDKQPTLIATHPEDFTIFQVGEFCGADIKGCERLALANGVDVRRNPLEVK